MFPTIFRPRLAVVPKLIVGAAKIAWASVAVAAKVIVPVAKKAVEALVGTNVVALKLKLPLTTTTKFLLLKLALLLSSTVKSPVVIRMVLL